MKIDTKPIKLRIDEIVKNGLHPHLKALGFKKRGRTFRRQRDDHCEIVAVSGATHNTNLDAGSIGSYGVELGIFFPDVFAIDGVKLNRDPSIHECYVYSGLNLPERYGFFDDLQGGFPDTAQQTRAVSDAWCEQGERWFSRFSSHKAAYEWVRAKSDWREAMYFAIYLEDSQGASECLGQCRRTCGGMLIKHIEAIATKHSVAADAND